MELAIALVCLILFIVGIVSNATKKGVSAKTGNRNGLATIDDSEGIVSLENVKMMDDANNSVFETLKKILITGKKYDDTDVEQNVAMNSVIHNPADKDVIEPMRISVTMLEKSEVKPRHFALEVGESCYLEAQHTMLYQCDRPTGNFKSRKHALDSKSLRSVKYITKGTLSITNKRFVLVEDDTYKVLSYRTKDFETYACVDENAIIIIKKGDMSLIYNFLLNLKLLKVPKHVASRWRYVIDCTRSRAVNLIDEIISNKSSPHELP